MSEKQRTGAVHRRRPDSPNLLTTADNLKDKVILPVIVSGIASGSYSMTELLITAGPNMDAVLLFLGFYALITFPRWRELTMDLEGGCIEIEICIWCSASIYWRHFFDSPYVMVTYASVAHVVNTQLLFHARSKAG